MAQAFRSFFFCLFLLRLTLRLCGKHRLLDLDGFHLFQILLAVFLHKVLIDLALPLLDALRRYTVPTEDG